jgi:hypothetical protein
MFGLHSLCFRYLKALLTIVPGSIVDIGGSKGSILFIYKISKNDLSIAGSNKGEYTLFIESGKNIFI